MGSARVKKKAQKVMANIATLLKRHGRELLGLLVLVIIVHDIFGTHGFLAMRRTQGEIKRVQANLDKLSKENEALAQEVKDLKSDPRLIEKIARDDLGLARPGEVIIRIPQGQEPEQNPATKR